MKLIKSYLTKNPCYTAGTTIKVKGLMLHSVGCPQPSALVFVNLWNKASYDNACVHAFIDGDTGAVYQTLPWNRRGWHCYQGNKGSGNDTHIGVEMCEPSTIRYTSGANWVETGDGKNTKATVLRTYKAAVELFAMLCKEYGLNPLADGVIISHKEGCARGIASNHGDPEHIWKKFGLSMNQFRKDVKAAMSGTTTADTSTGNSTSSAKVESAKYSDKSLNNTYKTTAALNMRTGAGTGKKIILTIPKGKSVKCSGYYNKDSNGTKWLYVTYNGQSGYCSSQYLSKQQTVSTPAKKPDVIYQVYAGGKWWNTITNYNTVDSNGYAGVFGMEISGIRVKLSNGKTVTVRSHISGKGRTDWLSAVTKWDNTSNGYSGWKGKPTDCIAMKADGYTLKYRVHVKGGGWLGWITKYNINDYENGLAGTYGKPIDAVQITVV